MFDVHQRDWGPLEFTPGSIPLFSGAGMPWDQQSHGIHQQFSSFLNSSGVSLVYFYMC